MGTAPAVDDHGASIWRVTGLNSAQERQEGGGVFRDSVIRPGCELKVTDLPLLVGAALRKQRRIFETVEIQDFKLIGVTNS